ncbi:mitochondrial glycerol-3-phosphate dehydrogenase [Steccherinum ochraceum]|uniref:glycerol-3-phosphate dehydrogenase n=1 Tax=Steccherinum ochraceum TaxID=92696 RepID=A0A4R0R9C6_9APHY|nr:mitochondrial glycerol-3-phosphate dehydrogenase [Steccherinum ochraceum]
MNSLSTPRRAVFSRRTLACVSGMAIFAAGGGYHFLSSKPAYPPPNVKTHHSRTEDDVSDMLIVGGGASWVEFAVDAASGGLRLALVERDDFSSGPSFKSAELVSGGIRYHSKTILTTSSTRSFTKPSMRAESSFNSVVPLRYVLNPAAHLSSDVGFLGWTAQ